MTYSEARGEQLRLLPIALAGTALVLSAAACGDSHADDGCMETSRSIGPDDPTAAGMTVSQVGSRFHIGGTSWSCSLAWGLIGEQTDATWSPHDTTTTAIASLRFGSGASEVTGVAPPGGRLACPTRLDIDVVFDLASEDGGLADSWNATGTFVAGTNDLSVQFAPRQAGGFRGSYTFTLLGGWPTTSTTVSVTAYSTHLEGSLLESAQRPTSSSSGEGFKVKSAVWLCEQSMPVAP